MAPSSRTQMVREFFTRKVGYKTLGTVCLQEAPSPDKAERWFGTR